MRRHAIMVVLGGFLVACSAGPAKESLFDDSASAPSAGETQSGEVKGETKPNAAGDACPGTQSLCAGNGSATAYCADFSSSPTNCGGCGKTCAAGTACTNGNCCSEGKTSCGGSCTDLKSDNANCGVCGTACQAGSVCWDGACVATCPKGEKTSKGCEVSYDVFAGTEDVIGTTAKCGDGQVYNNCSSKPVAFKWRDQGPSMPKSVRVSFESGIFCPTDGASVTQTVKLNGEQIGSFDGRSSACTCAAKSEMFTFEVSATAMESFKKAGSNLVEIEGKNTCIGFKMSDRFGGAVARVDTLY
jgi:hypothetical protein